MIKKSLILSIAAVPLFGILLLGGNIEKAEAQNFVDGSQSFDIKNESNQELERHATKEVNDFIESNDLNAIIENLNISIREDIDISQYTSKELEILLANDIENMKSQLQSFEYKLTANTPEITPYLINNGGGQYTSEIWAGVPSVGWSTVKQDFKAKVSGGKVSSVSFLGGGYMTGVSWGRYNHIRSWSSIYSGGKYVDIYIKGTINYTFNLINSNATSTFKEELKVSGSSLVRAW